MYISFFRCANTSNFWKWNVYHDIKMFQFCCSFFWRSVVSWCHSSSWSQTPHLLNDCSLRRNIVQSRCLTGVDICVYYASTGVRSTYASKCFRCEDITGTTACSDGNFNARELMKTAMTCDGKCVVYLIVTQPFKELEKTAIRRFSQLGNYK